MYLFYFRDHSYHVITGLGGLVPKMAVAIFACYHAYIVGGLEKVPKHGYVIYE